MISSAGDKINGKQVYYSLDPDTNQYEALYLKGHSSTRGDVDVKYVPANP